MSRLRLSRSDERALVDGASALGVMLDERAVASCASYAALLETWSARTNLISCAAPRELVERHLLDSLAVAGLLAGCRRIVDLGSGAGFPGIPLAIAVAGLEVMLVEPRRRRANFLRAVRRELGLSTVSVSETRAEAGPVGDQFETAVCRAVWSDATALPIVSRWLVPNGRFLWMREGEVPSDAGAADLELDRTATYRIGEGPVRQVQIYGRR